MTTLSQAQLERMKSVPLPAGATADTTDAVLRARGLEAGKRLMADKGYEQVTLTEVARAAGMSEALLLRLYGSKQGLLEGIFNAFWESLNPRLAEIVLTTYNAREATLAILSVMMHVLQKDRDLAKLLMFEGRRRRGPNGEILVSEGFRDFTKLGFNLVARGQKDGSFSRVFEPAVITSALLGATEGLFRDQLIAEQYGRAMPYSESQMASAFDTVVSSFAP
jgi:AcrR family transcriptional regulator